MFSGNKIPEPFFCKKVSGFSFLVFPCSPVGTVLSVDADSEDISFGKVRVCCFAEAAALAEGAANGVDSVAGNGPDVLLSAF